jgi:hypothetical protein
MNVNDLKALALDQREKKNVFLSSRISQLKHRKKGKQQNKSRSPGKKKTFELKKLLPP